MGKIFGTIAVILLIGILAHSCGLGGGGDGVNSCRNCGRSRIYSGGLCKSCFDGFVEWSLDD